MTTKKKLQRRVSKLEAKGIHGVKYQVDDFIDLVNESRVAIAELRHNADKVDDAGLKVLRQTGARVMDKPALGKVAYAALKDLNSAMEHFRRAADAVQKVAKKAR
jgi:hypothetical protein